MKSLAFVTEDVENEWDSYEMCSEDDCMAYEGIFPYEVCRFS